MSNKFLDKINFPSDLKSLSLGNLEDLAIELRNKTIVTEVKKLKYPRPVRYEGRHNFKETINFEKINECDKLKKLENEKKVNVFEKVVNFRCG